MKVIKKGKLKNQTKNETCDKCDTEFEFEEKDIKQDRDGSYVKCPVCGSFITAK